MAFGRAGFLIESFSYIFISLPFSPSMGVLYLYIHFSMYALAKSIHCEIIQLSGLNRPKYLLKLKRNENMKLNFLNKKKKAHHLNIFCLSTLVPFKLQVQIFIPEAQQGLK